MAQLISWTTNPPPQVDEVELAHGLAEAFGRLKVTAARDSPSMTG